MIKHELKTALENLVDFLIIKATKASQPGGLFKNRMSKRLAKALKYNFNRQMVWLLREVGNLPAFNQSASVKLIDKKDVNQDVGDMLEGLPLVETMADDIVLYASGSLTRGAKARIQAMNLGRAGISFSLNHPEAVSYLEKLKSLQLSNYRGAISKTTKETIKKLLVDGANNGLSYSEISKQIQLQGEAGVFSQARGELIATREIGFAYSNGERIVVDDYVQKTGATIEKNWQTAEDANVRPEHTANQAAGWIPIDQAFPGTGEDAAPSEDFGCRCVTSYREV